METTEQMRCTGCVFFENVDDSFKNGKCHRHPPQYDGHAIAFPFVMKTDWCGEFVDVEKAAETDRVPRDLYAAQLQQLERIKAITSIFKERADA